MHPDSAPFYEFFAGGGLARLGLEQSFHCVFANDNDPAKAEAYLRAFPGAPFRLEDVWRLTPADLPGRAALAWASFPCQDLSLAGARGGLSAPRSGAFWGFHRIISALALEARAPETLALENVCGLLTSRGGADFAALIAALDALGYRAGALEIDAAHFTPHSRPRLFIIATRTPPPPAIVAEQQAPPFHSPGVVAAYERLMTPLKARWIWWRAPAPPKRNTILADLLEPDDAVAWRSAAQTQALISLMNPQHRARLEALKANGARTIGAVYRRIRIESGQKVQRAEARFDGLAGCLRTPAGGSSRQLLLFVEGQYVRSRWLSAREAARLMGVGDDYPIPERTSAALHLFGDAVSVPVVRFLADSILTPLARAAARALARA